MAAPASISGHRSLLRTTLLRSLALGRIYLVIGLAYVLVLGSATSFSSSSSFTGSFPIILPIFAALGSMGALMVFINDRTKGVLEYLIAYGISPRRLFFNVLSVSLLTETLALALFLGVGLGVFVVAGHSIAPELVTTLIAYSIPMSYASAVLAATVGMVWTSVSSPRSGINSPIGLVPIVAIGPSVLTLGLVAFLALHDPAKINLVAGVVAGAVLALSLLLLGLLDRLLPRERFLSPM